MSDTFSQSLLREIAKYKWYSRVIVALLILVHFNGLMDIINWLVKAVGILWRNWP